MSPNLAYHKCSLLTPKWKPRSTTAMKGHQGEVVEIGDNSVDNPT